MSNPTSDIAVLRREQIVEAAIAVIAEQGIQNLSLSEIEKKAGMSRGQLVYYFGTKESILLAVFDRVLHNMYKRLERISDVHECAGHQMSGWELIQVLLEVILMRPPNMEFGCLQYTFLSQMSHREDFRERLAKLYEEWRNGMTLGLEQDRERGLIRADVNARGMATFVQALLHGLAMQRMADPNAFDSAAMLQLCRQVLGRCLGIEADMETKGKLESSHDVMLDKTALSESER